MKLQYLIPFLLLAIKAQGQTPDAHCVGEPGTIYWFFYGDVPYWSLEELNGQPHYPQSPTVVKTLNAIEAPNNYYQHFGATMQGFIRPPETGYYTFNLTGDDYSAFDFTRNGAGDTLTRLAYIPGWTQEDEHDKYQTQTTDSLFLDSTQYYYFKVMYKEHGGGDHANLFWKRPSVHDTMPWELIHRDYIYNDACLSFCPPAGTPCDDGNPDTYNDQQDGHCHCLGTPNNLPRSCAGAPGTAHALYYDTIYSDHIEDLLSAPTFPLQPSRSEALNRLSGPLDRADHYGTRVRAWLRVPESGFYQFNVTGENQVRLYLSYRDDLPYEDMEIARLDWRSGSRAYQQQPEQTSDSIWLMQDSLYYLELLHVDRWGGDFFRVNWKTPFSPNGDWQILDGFFLHAYTCETACVPEGLPCDDGNPMTFDDQYNSQCSCEGTPCADADCSNNRPYEPYASCGNQGTHSTHPDDSWQSCRPSPSPNPERGISHWIEYDLGQLYVLDEVRVWNYNVPGATDRGFRRVAVDYSADGTHWSEAGVFNWNEATGQIDYAGFSWTQLSGIGARFLLLTALDNHGGNCSGLSEIRFDVSECPSVGTPCDDGDPATTGDTFNALCECLGTPDLSNICTSQDTTVSGTIPVGRYNASSTIVADGRLEPGSKTVLIAGDLILLRPGFHAGPNNELHALIRDCQPGTTAVDSITPTQLVQQEATPAPSAAIVRESSNDFGLNIRPNPTQDWGTIAYTLPREGVCSLEIKTASGQLVQRLVQEQRLPAGTYQKEVGVQRWPAGVYFVSLTFSGAQQTERMIVIRP